MKMQFDMENKGHITESGKCCFCGADYTNYGNSTWGYWTQAQEEQCFGENMRCCDKCYLEKISPARQRKAAALKAGIIPKFECDL